MDIDNYKRLFSLALRGDSVPSSLYLSYPGIGVYTGNGSSHSWLWLADLFEKYGLYDISFISGKDIQNDALERINLLIVSGGDTFAIAEEINESGSEKIKEFLEKGGAYIGICAGAYLMLNSTKTPLNFFNFTAGKIKNLSSTLPSSINMSYKFSVPYGCQYIYHPVRGSMQIKSLGIPPFYSKDIINSPVFGGGFMIPSEDLIPLADYHGFTKDTIFLVDDRIASETVIGSCAAAKCQYGKGIIFLYSPHFEHPMFPDGNNIIIDTICYSNTARKRKSLSMDFSLSDVDSPDRESLKKIKSLLSNSRIIAGGFNGTALYWKIGNKVWEAEKFSVFLDTIWKRANQIEKDPFALRINLSESQELEKFSADVLNNLKKLKSEISSGKDKDSEETSKKLFFILSKLSSKFFNIYFRSKLKNALDMKI